MSCVVRDRLGGLIQTASGSGLGFGSPETKALGMSGPCLAKHGLSAGDDLICPTEVDVFGG